MRCALLLAACAYAKRAGHTENKKISAKEQLLAERAGVGKRKEAKGKERVVATAPLRQPFIVITTQRTGSAMLMEWLRQRDCVKTGLELFINGHHATNVQAA